MTVPLLYFNPRAPCGARLLVISFLQISTYFNPRAPCGARHKNVHFGNGSFIFQSTRPVRGATGQHGVCRLNKVISIHAPRAGRDCPCCAHKCVRGDFNPRAPCGARQGFPLVTCIVRFISIHAPRAGRDRHTITHSRRRKYFNPRAPCGARLTLAKSRPGRSYFNPRAPCGARQINK